MSDDAPPAQQHRRLRRVGGIVLTILIALAGAVGVLLYFEGRDSSQVDRGASTVAGPGQLLPDQGHAHLRPGQRPVQPYASDPPTSGPHVPLPIRRDGDGTRLSDDQLLHALELGDVVLLYGSARPPAAAAHARRPARGTVRPRARGDRSGGRAGHAAGHERRDRARLAPRAARARCARPGARDVRVLLARTRRVRLSCTLAPATERARLRSLTT